MEHARKIFMESMEYWQTSIEQYEDIIVENKLRMVDPLESESKKKASAMLVEICENEIKKCQKQIEKLLED